MSYLDTHLDDPLSNSVGKKREGGFKARNLGSEITWREGLNWVSVGCDGEEKMDRGDVSVAAMMW